MSSECWSSLSGGQSVNSMFVHMTASYAVNIFKTAFVNSSADLSFRVHKTENIFF
jgi:hypothetical protein